MSQTLPLRDLSAHFKDRAERSGAKVWQVPDLTTAAQTVTTILSERDSRSNEGSSWESGTIAVPASLAATPEFKTALGEKLVEATGTAVITGAWAGVSWGEFGIAETGSVVYAVNNLLERQIAMLSPIYFALLNKTSLIPGLAEAAVLIKKLQTEEGRRYVSFVTGPSRTADIERVLTVGVQGPKEFFILLLGS